MSSSRPCDSSSQERMFDRCDFDSEAEEIIPPIITKEIVEEEEALKKMSKHKIAQLKKKNCDEEYEKKMVELRRKRLLNLLERSQFYSEYISQKMSDSKQLSDKENKVPNKKRKRGNGFDINDYDSEDIRSACKKKLDPGDRVVNHVEASTVEDKEESTRVTGLGITVPASQPELLEGCCLRDYQMQGLDWLKLLFEAGMNGILADEMGLGKTVQTIALLCNLYQQKLPGPFLVVGPLSTLPNWVLEFESFAPKVPVVLYHGTGPTRIGLQNKIQKKYSLYGQKVFPVVITSFEVPIVDEYFLNSLSWKYIIVDEGHRLKNYKTLLSRTLKNFKSENRVLLTGTPLQNNLTELWSLLHFLLPEIFDSLDAFQSWFQVEDMESSDNANRLIEQEQESHIIALLNKILTPFLLRRVKTDVNLNLPPKKEVHVYCPMSEVQLKLYTSIVDKSIDLLRDNNTKFGVIPDNEDGSRPKRKCRSQSAVIKDNSDSHSTKGNIIIMNSGDDQYIINIKLTSPMIMMRKVANHPYLVQMPVYPGSDILRIDKSLITSSGKFTMLDELLRRLKERSHKVLIFSTFTMILNLLEELMHLNDYKFERLDGSSKVEDRRKSICQFNTDPDTFAFLLSTRAGGLGINLNAADTVVIFDSDWNPQVDLQAQDRCHRIGQTRPVIVYRLITEGTIDEKIVTRAAAKRKLEKIVIQEGQFKYKLNSKARKELMDLEELKILLQKKLHSCDVKSSHMSEEEWNKLLDRMTMS